MTAGPLPRYRAEPAERMLVRSLDEITLVYHRPSGRTHMVMSPVPEILAALAGGEGSADDILARLSREFDLGDAAGALAAVTAHLDELVALGLVSRA